MTKITCDTTEIQRTLSVLFSPGDVVELRILDAQTSGDRRPHIESGYFDDWAKLAEAAATIGKAKGWYVCLNPVNSALLARAANRIRPVGKEPTTSDPDILRRRWLPIDLDAVRPAGISSTDEEHKAALDFALTIRDHLAAVGWPEPVLADSGNGAHLLYRVDLPADDGGLVERCLKALAARFSDARVDLDTAVHNPARIWKVYGTPACKGDSTPHRPHRMARLLAVPSTIEVVPAELLEGLAGPVTAAEPTSTRQTSNGRFDLNQWIARHALQVDGPQPWRGGGRRWVFPVCPWNPEHRNRSAFIVQGSDGTIGAGCHHNGCAGKGWHDLRDAVEPGWRERRTAKPTGSGEKRQTRRAELSEWRPFPVDALPEPVARYVQAAADSIGCDPAFVALPLLSALAGAVGTSTRIELKRDWREPSILWTGIVGDSGTHKSPAWKAGTRFADQQDAREIRFFHEEQTAYEAEQQRYEAELKAWQRKPTGPAPEKPVPPRCRRFLIDDVTIEALADRLADNPRGVLVARDELAGWLDSFNQYRGGRGADTAAWLSIHNAGSLRVDRRGGDRKTIFVQLAAVSLTGGIQPPILARSLGAFHFQDGLAARLLVAMPPKTPRKWTERTIPDDATEAVGRVFARLWSLEANVDGDGDLRPLDLPLTPEAQQAWIAFYNRHGAELTALTGDLAAAWSKLEGYAARLALVCHLADWAAGSSATPGPVDQVAVESGIALTEWFKNETRRVYAVLGEGDEERADRELVDLIRAHGGTITARELMHATRQYRGSSEAAEAALDGLATSGDGVWEPQTAGPQGGRPTRVFRLHVDGNGNTTHQIPGETEVPLPLPPCEQENEVVEWTG